MPKSAPRNYTLAQLLMRVFAIKVLQCDRFGGRMRILAATHPPEAIRKILDSLGPPSRPLPVARAYPERDIDELDFS